ncbi:Protein serine/threonine phosphatase PrpC, regulation of stationary phase [hydrothermal vent metagenome]|uniref:Protein serine/threonine phosphatase PrpC, regulation of stationary phase n=1 Tax=hydrothermal vent metagenome TaxID=652676 RepID=A0A3B0ZU95_9ZZZZ
MSDNANKNSSKIDAFGLTDVGQVRDHNEDAIDCDIERGMFILADGMGGHNAGEVASALAMESIKHALYDVLTPEIIDSEIVDYNDALYEAITYANTEIFEQALENTEYAGMGTTLVMALIHNGKALIANVGDSRLYVNNGSTLTQLTTDHSLVQEMVDNGYLSEEEAYSAVSRNLITRALGISEEVEVDLIEHEIQQGDIFLLCSDGLSDLVIDEEISAILSESGSLSDAGKKLVAAANDRGGKDNISVILITMRKAFSDDSGYEGSVA